MGLETTGTYRGHTYQIIWHITEMLWLTEMTIQTDGTIGTRQTRTEPLFTRFNAIVDGRPIALSTEAREPERQDPEKAVREYIDHLGSY